MLEFYHAPWSRSSSILWLLEDYLARLEKRPAYQRGE